MTNHELVRALIQQHGVDRYPTVQLNVMKVMEELGELVRNFLRGLPMVDELADVAISLYAIADKLDIDLDAAIEQKVISDHRVFMRETQ